MIFKLFKKKNDYSDIDPFSSENLDHHDTFYEMKCTSCGFEGKLPDIAIEESEYKNPVFHCPKCDRPTYYLKDYALKKKKN